MPIVKLIDLFKFSPDGIQVLEYPPGEHDLDGRALEVAESMGIIDDSAEKAAREQAEREAAEKVAREQAEREAAEKAGQGGAAEGAAAAASEASAKPDKRAPKGAAKSG